MINKSYLMFLLMFSFMSIKLFSIEKKTIMISFDEKISDGMLGVNIEMYDWEIALDNQIIKNGYGISLFDFKFSTPGTYQLYLNKKHELYSASCNHDDDNYSFEVIVSDKKVVYDLGKIKFSDKIEANKDCSSIIVYIPVQVFSDSKIRIPDTIVSVGINTTIIGVLNETQKYLTSGKYILEYRLSGFAQAGTYIGFDLKDVNERVITYYLPYPIN